MLVLSAEDPGLGLGKLSFNGAASDSPKRIPQTMCTLTNMSRIRGGSTSSIPPGRWIVVPALGNEDDLIKKHGNQYMKFPPRCRNPQAG